MRYVDEFRDPKLIVAAAEEIARLAAGRRHYRIMEVCGGHTHSIYRFSLEELLPPNIELVHGPGCPVCVLPMGRTDDGLASRHVGQHAPAQRQCFCKQPARIPAPVGRCAEDDLTRPDDGAHDGRPLEIHVASGVQGHGRRRGDRCGLRAVAASTAARRPARVRPGPTPHGLLSGSGCTVFRPQPRRGAGRRYGQPTSVRL